jgi:peptidoglycan/xylan/chitin deacetylase (PgdA/CDA1 family)
LKVDGVWPGGARAAVSVSVDNLGEAAELELGLRQAGSEVGDHYSVTTALPVVLDAFAAHDLLGTFFVEGINAELYPGALRRIREAGHEVGYHAWCHEDWGTLDPEAEATNLDRGLAAFRNVGIDAVGLRPPGGRITASTLQLLARRGLHYCSPAGSRPGFDQVAVLPFAWEAVDVFHVLPVFATLRERVTGRSEAGGPDRIRAALWQVIQQALASGGHAVLVLHTWMIEFERDVVHDVLACIRAGVDEGIIWAAPCCEIASWIADRPASFPAPPILDETSWSSSA